MKARAIIHVDMDAFYASVEQREHPEWKDKPVIVGGSPESRGVVSSASYEARKFGVHSAMPSAQAHRLCPAAVFVPPHFDLYEKASDQIMGIFHKYTEQVEPLSLDEAYLDVTESPQLKTTVTNLAKEIKEEIFQTTRLTASAGVGPNKFIAKIASDHQKPNGLTVIRPKEVRTFLENLPIQKMWGVGKVTEQHFKSMGIKTIGQIRKIALPRLIEQFGKSGYFFYKLAFGEDDRPVEAHTECKSIGQETTFERDTVDLEFMKEILLDLAQCLSQRLVQNEIRAHTVTLKVKYHDFQSVTRSKTFVLPQQKPHAIFNAAMELLDKTLAGTKEIRLLGISTSNFESKRAIQLLLFEELFL
jgi:DNA polymerase-4